MDEAATTMSQERSEMRPRNTLPPQSVFSIKFLKILKNISKIFFFLFFFLYLPSTYMMKNISKICIPMTGKATGGVCYDIHFHNLISSYM